MNWTQKPIKSWHVAMVLALVTVVMQMLCNIDSYLYAQCGQFDSAVFFMCGKAMMNGMVPYADFTDSKGVLLWFIYGLGYLFDHYSYVGVFWLSCLNMWATLLIAFRTARLWLDRRASLLAAIFLIIPLTYWNFYTETKAEHFCWPAVAWGIYVLMRGQCQSAINRKHGVWLGVGLVACLMLKWSVALMMLSLVFSVGWMAWQGGSLKKYLLGFFCGILLSIMPFVVAFSCWRNWSDLWREYFVNTLSSVSVPLAETVSLYAGEWAGMFTTRRFLYLLYTLPVLTLWNKKKWFASALPALCGLFFIALSIRHDFAHYVTVAGPFAILTIVVVMRWAIGHHVRLRYMMAVLLLAQSYVVWGSIHYSQTFFTKAGDQFNHFMAVSAAMSCVADHPTIIHVGMEIGLCQGTSLPGTRYWITQHGRTEAMWKEELAEIAAGNADFVRCPREASVHLQKILSEAGYVYWMDDIYSRVPLDKTLAIKPFSPMDIVCKKTYREKYGLE